MPEKSFCSESYPNRAEYGPLGFEGDISLESHQKMAAELMAAGRAVAIDNDAVWAIWGDSGSDNFAHEVRTIKGRDPSRALGLTMPYHEFVPLIDFDRVHSSVIPLLEDPDRLTERLGAMAFIRVPGNALFVIEKEVPDCVITYGQNDLPVLQNYDCKGKANINSLIEYAKELGVEYPAVSSLNSSGRPEITEPEDAIRFARDHNLPILADIRAVRKGTGSYPILEFNSNGVSLVREGNISGVLIKNLMHEYKISVPQTIRPAAYSPYNGSDNLELRELRGSELREALIENFGWSNN